MERPYPPVAVPPDLWRSGHPAIRPWHSTFAGAMPRAAMSTAHPSPTAKISSLRLSDIRETSRAPRRYPRSLRHAPPSGRHPADEPVKHPITEQPAQEEKRLGILTGGIARLGPLGSERLEDCVGNNRRRRPQPVYSQVLHRGHHSLEDIGIGRVFRSCLQRPEGDIAEFRTDKARLDDDDVDAELLQLEPQTVRPSFKHMLRGGYQEPVSRTYENLNFL